VSCRQQPHSYGVCAGRRRQELPCRDARTSAGGAAADFRATESGDDSEDASSSDATIVW
jgi:hypothetical protein